MVVEKYCAYCNKELQTHRSIYCSKTCANKKSYDKREQITTLCGQCKKEFKHFDSKKRKYCSIVCSSKANRGKTNPLKENDS